MSEQLIQFESFARDCEYLNNENDIFAECLHKENLNESCIEGGCPRVMLASLADVLELDPDSYAEQAASFTEELARGDDKEDLLPCDKGNDLVVWNGK